MLKEIEEKEQEKKNKEIEMEITWGLGQKEKAEKLLKEKMKENKLLTMTPFEKIIEKKKEKKRQKMKEKKEKVTYSFTKLVL